VVGARCDKKKNVILIFVFVTGGACKSGTGFTRSGRMGAAYRSIDTKKLTCVS
jgi:hypothetical protein